MIIREKIKDGVYFTSAEYAYKRSRLGIYLSFPALRETQTATALLPYMLERGTASCPDKVRLGRRLSSLYGADLKSNYNQYGAARLLSVAISGADAAFLPNGRQIADERAQLLSDLLCDPVIENDTFRDDWIDIEREKLGDTIRSLINDKREYCLRKLTDCLYAGDSRSLAPDGYEQDLFEITGESLYSVYKSILAQCNVEIIYAGNDVKSAYDCALKIADRISTTPIEIVHPGAVKKRQPIEIVEKMNVEQDKLALGFTTGRTLNHEELSALRVGCMLLGGTATSRLFMNVREKQSLCYYVSSSASYESGGGAIIECGVAKENATLARNAIMAELEKLANNGPTEKEMDEMRLTLKNAFRGLTDSASAISSYLQIAIVRDGKLTTPHMMLDELLSISAEQARKALSDLSLFCTCRITSEGEKQA